MKRRPALSAWMTAGLTLITSTAMIQPVVADQGFSVTPGIGFYKFDDDLDIDDEGFANIGLQYLFDNNFAVEASWGFSDTDEKYNTLSNSIDWRYARIDALYYFNEGQKMRPYLAFGAGEGELEINADKFDETLINAGGGVQFLVGKALSIRTDLRAINSQDNETTSGLATVSLSYLFGNAGDSSSGPDFEISQTATSDSDNDGIFDPADRCANTPVGISVDTSGCALDSDLDGIADYQDQCLETPNGINVDNEGCPQDLDNDGIADYQDRCLSTTAGSLVDQQGCAVRISDIAPTISDLAFSTGSAEMNKAFIGELQSLATFLQRYQNTVAVIEGHADSTGDASFNKALSEKRAQNVRSILIQQFGINPERLRTIGYGESRPVASNTTPAGRAKNRRVDTKIETIQ